MNATDTFPRLLQAQLRKNPGRPLVTAYDEASGERTELSVTTYANWVAKTANLFAEEYLLGEGDCIRLDLPPHWLGTIFLGAAWSAGIVVATEAGAAADLVVTGPGTDAAGAPGGPVLACALLPFAVRSPEPFPAGIDDYGLLWPGQPDIHVASLEPAPDTPAHSGPAGVRSQGELLDEARAISSRWQGDRLITDVGIGKDCGTGTFLAALVKGGSLVLVTHPRDDRWPARLEGERATDLLRSDPV